MKIIDDVFLLENFIDKFDYVNVNEFREDKNNRDAILGFEAVLSEKDKLTEGGRENHEKIYMKMLQKWKQ